MLILLRNILIKICNCYYNSWVRKLSSKRNNAENKKDLIGTNEVKYRMSYYVELFDIPLMMEASRWQFLNWYIKRDLIVSETILYFFSYYIFSY